MTTIGTTDEPDAAMVDAAAGLWAEAEAIRVGAAVTSRYVEDQRRGFVDNMARADAWLTVAIDGGEVVGAVGGFLSSQGGDATNRIDVGYLVVAERRRGQGSAACSWRAPCCGPVRSMPSRWCSRSTRRTLGPDRSTKPRVGPRPAAPRSHLIARRSSSNTGDDPRTRRGPLAWRNEPGSVRVRRYRGHRGEGSSGGGPTMAKKKPRSGRPVPGGRVTPKGVRPDEHKSRHQDDDGTATAAPPPPQPTRINPARGGPPINQHAPTRAGHHRGQR